MLFPLSICPSLLATDLPSAEACRWILIFVGPVIVSATFWLVKAFLKGDLMLGRDHQAWIAAHEKRYAETVERYTKWIDGLKIEAEKDQASLQKSNDIGATAVNGMEKLTDRVEQLAELLRAKSAKPKIPR